MTDNKPAMEYVQFGKTGLRISKICVGCMSFGTPKWMPWVLEEKESLELIGKAYAAGINFFDTADAYSGGGPRGRIVVAAKCYSAVRSDDEAFGNPCPYEDPKYINQCGLSCKHLFEVVDASLERLVSNSSCRSLYLLGRNHGSTT
ncbi:NADP-dependent oxidoreductase domain-containing protein [Absidia repens]|uniref:NADP-dependent oxidoreductase domain-containing protein n=1 Tax=Absidia repens TaxID=90262 RepID=A0A1X2I8H1_9FUNG|nr:NADP-dependent oxidoreductase domain-containing protein [Absidia repens]